HVFELHRARVVEHEHDVRIHGRGQEQRGVGDVVGAAAGRRSLAFGGDAGGDRAGAATAPGAELVALGLALAILPVKYVRLSTAAELAEPGNRKGADRLQLVDALPAGPVVALVAEGDLDVDHLVAGGDGGFGRGEVRSQGEEQCRDR